MLKVQTKLLFVEKIYCENSATCINYFVVYKGKFFLKIKFV